MKDRVSPYRCFPGCRPLLSAVTLLLAWLLGYGDLQAQGQFSIRALDQLPGQEHPVEYLEGELIVRFRPGAGESARRRFREENRVRSYRVFSPDSLYLIRLDPERADAMIRDRRIYADLELVQPNYIYRLEMPAETSEELQTNGAAGELPNDPELFRQWGLYNEGQNFRGSLRGTAGADISATLAWEVTRGSHDVIVAVFDTGIDYEHPDLAANIFRDPLGRPGADCSPSGLTGGVCGDDPMDSHGHGTHVAGIIGAAGNNGLGISGVNWQVQLMAVKVFTEDPRNPNEQITSTASLLAGYEYALANGARISNHSYGGPGRDPAQEQRIRQAGLQGHLVVASAGNFNPSSGGEDPQQPVYPAAYDLDNVLSVASSNHLDRLSSFSRYGSHVLIAAPGEHIYSTRAGGGYQYSSGTSMAAPHVAGSAALIYSVFPDHGVEEVVGLLLDEADRVDALDGFVQQSRRLNAWRSLPAARLQFTAASPDPEAEVVRIELNGRELIPELAFGSTSSEVRVPAGADMELVVYSGGMGALSGPLLSETIHLPRDRFFRYLLVGRTGGGSLLAQSDGLQFVSYEPEIGHVPEQRARLRFLNTVDDGLPVGLFAFWPGIRPPLSIDESLGAGLFLPGVLIPAGEVELDLTREEERLETYAFTVEPQDEGGHDGLVVVGGGGPDPLFLLYSRGEGPGLFASAAIPSGGVMARHRPGSFSLEDNFPNPFQGQTMIQFTLPEEREVVLEVYDLTGRRVQRLLGRPMPAGIHRIPFDGAGLASGLYIYRVRAGEDLESGKMLLVR